MEPRFKMVAMPGEYGFAIKLGRESVALVRATRGVLPDGSEISGNFLAGGDHCVKLAKAVHSIGREVREDARRPPKRADLRAQRQRRLLEPPVDSRAEWQRQQEASLQMQREAWERRQRENEKLQRIREAQAAKVDTPQQTASAAEEGERAQGAAERP